MLSFPANQAQSAMDFFERYARTVLASLPTPFANSRYPYAEEPYFSIAAEAADSLREAAQWALLLRDAGNAARLLAEAGALYLRMGLPYGLYLLTAAGVRHQQSELNMFADQLQRATSLTRPADQEQPIPDPGRDGDLAVLQPQQQAYLVLAASGSLVVAERSAEELATLLYTSPLRDGVLEVGALGTPIRELWEIAIQLSQQEPDVKPIAAQLSRMADRYSGAMELAQTNDYLWENGAAPVDVVDLEIAGIAAIAARRLERGQLLNQLAPVTDLDSVAGVPISAGLALASWHDDRPRESRE